MWEIGNQKILIDNSANEEIGLVKGYLEEKEASEMLVKYLRANVGIATRVLMGVELFPFQEIAIKSMLNRDFSLLVWSRGLSKSFTCGIFAVLQAIFQPNSRIAIISRSFRQCSSEDTYIFTDKGLKLIRDCEIGQKTQSIIRPNEILNKWENPLENGIKIVTKKGYELKGKVGHKHLIWDSLNCRFKWINIEDISASDFLPVHKGTHLWGDASITNFPSVGLNLECDPRDVAYLFGLYYGDGHFDKKRASLSIVSADKEILDSCTSILSFICPSYKARTRNKADSGCKSISCSSVALRDFFDAVGVNFKTAREKSIPSGILALNKDETSSFLSGLFDTDGGIYISKKTKGATISFCTSSSCMANQVQLMLLNFGIISDKCYEAARGKIKICSVDTYGHEGWKIRIAGYDNLKKFSDHINFRLPRKKNTLLKYLEKCSSVKDTNRVPGLSTYLKKKYKHIRTWGVRKNQFFSKKAILKETIRKVLDSNNLKPWMENDDVQLLNELLDRDFYYDSIESVSPEKMISYDITVENEKCYVGNGLISKNSRLIFQKIEEIMGKPHARLLQECVIGQPKHMQDEWSMKIGSSIIGALPLGSGEKLRGFRFNTLLIDEFLLMPEKIVNEVIMPFLSVNTNPVERQKASDSLQQLVNEGMMSQDEKDSRMKMIFKDPKMIALTSASYQFEYLYEMYCKYIEKIRSGTEDGGRLMHDGSNKLKGSYCVLQFAYDMAPSELYSESLLEKAKTELSVAQFKREFGAQFTDDSSGYYSVKAMNECTVPDGEAPFFEIKGSGDSNYVLSIDPSFSEDESSDFFAMSVFKVLEGKKFMLVHCYAVAGGKLKDHIVYLLYILKNFNISFVIMDNAGGVQFMNSANESKTFKDAGVSLSQFKGIDFNRVDDYQKELKDARRQYKPELGVKVYMQVFNSDWIRRSNELLQANIDNKRIRFAGDASIVDSEVDKMMKLDIGIDPLKFSNDGEDGEEDDDALGGMSASSAKEVKQLDLIERQQFLMNLTKKQCAMIDVKTTEGGNQTFTLPSELKNLKGKRKARRDLYTTLLLGSWGVKVYNDFMDKKNEQNTSFEPFFM